MSNKLDNLTKQQLIEKLDYLTKLDKLTNSLTTENVCSIISACGAHGVDKITFQGLEVSFNSEPRISNVESLIPQSIDGSEEEASPVDFTIETEKDTFEHEQLCILDPSGFMEKHELGGLELAETEDISTGADLSG